MGDAADPSRSEPVLTGWLYRESNLLDGVCNARFAALQGRNLVTYREQDSIEPTKVWPLHSGCRLTPMTKKPFRIRPRHKSTLWTVAAGKHIRKDLYTFAIVWPSSHMFGRDDLRLCFEEEAEAEAWRKALEAVIRRLIYGRLGSNLNMTVSVAEALPESESLPHLRTSSTDGFEDAEDGDGLAFGAGQHELEDDLPCTTNGGGRGLSWYCSNKSWASLRRVNGVSVYQEEEGPGGQGGAYMVSTIVRSAPASVFKTLLGNGQKPFLQNTRVLETLDPQTHIIQGDLATSGYLPAVCTPREVVVQQTWRMDSDGTYIVLVQSTEHPSAPVAASSYVRARVVAAGFTIAPLQPQYVREGAPQESLVTMVVKLDLGGWLGDGTLLGTYAGPFVRPMREAFVEPMLMAITSLRDQVEQNRFVVKPFQMGLQSEPEAYQQASLLQRRLPKPTSMREEEGGAGPPAGPPEPLGAGEYEGANGVGGQPAGVSPVGAGPGESSGIGDGGGPPGDRGSCDPRYWSCPGAAGFHIRGANYLHDRKKIIADEPLFELASVDLVDLPKPMLHLAPHLPSVRDSKAPFLFVVQLMVPGPPHQALVISWEADYDPRQEAGEAGPSFDNVLTRFLEGDGPEADDRRNGVFKLIPSVVEGSWIIRQSVGNTPVILGRKLKTYYFKGANYIEVDVDIASSRAAGHVVGLVKPVTTSLVIDMAILLEGHKDDELPEHLLGTVRFSRLNMKTAAVPLP
eukprot:jgi/Botrbrau1/12650/Bobra.67_1s0016.1